MQGGGRYVDPAPTSTQAHGCAKVGVGMFGMGAFGRDYAEKARKTEGGGAVGEVYRCRGPHFTPIHPLLEAFWRFSDGCATEAV